MSTHNIGFYEDLTKIIFELSSNIIKYAPYFFCWAAIMLTCSCKVDIYTHGKKLGNTSSPNFMFLKFQ